MISCKQRKCCQCLDATPCDSFQGTSLNDCIVLGIRGRACYLHGILLSNGRAISYLWMTDKESAPPHCCQADSGSSDARGPQQLAEVTPVLRGKVTLLRTQLESLSWAQHALQDSSQSHTLYTGTTPICRWAGQSDRTNLSHLISACKHLDISPKICTPMYEGTPSQGLEIMC